ncbi:hypothetical protein Bealeia1_01994 (plasmid) [Candidatus Bealeia paramacronuclearis]|uniref:Uncharacterized protein n=1 Tax=Candidatus Bealeia paramacronuclearis TaxID=1921001 RepID=A0ABZ2C8E3_9PROT|nr:hypothetical protein [Candidatus Bealeia paramacronuclearis]
MNTRNPTTLNALLVSDDITPRPCGSRAVIVEIQADDGTLLLPRLTRIMLSQIQYATSHDVSFGVNGMLAYNPEGDQLVVFSQGRWKAVLTQDLDLPPPLTLVPAQMNGELPESYAIAASEIGSDLETVYPSVEPVISIPISTHHEMSTASSLYPIAQPATPSVTDATAQNQEMTKAQELANLNAQKALLESELTSIQLELSTIQTTGK